MHCQISNLSPLMSCVSFCFFPTESYIWCICGLLNMCWASKYMDARLWNYCGCSVLVGLRGLVCLGFWNCFSTLAIRARVSCRDNQVLEMVPLDGIGGAFVLGIVLEGIELYPVLFGRRVTNGDIWGTGAVGSGIVFVVQRWLFVCVVWICFVGTIHLIKK